MPEWFAAQVAGDLLEAIINVTKTTPKPPKEKQDDRPAVSKKR